MVSGGKVGGRRNNRKRGGLKDKGSDDSDEDYVVSDDEVVVSDDDFEYCSLDERVSEESLGSFVEDEDGEEEKEVRREVVARPGVRRGSFAKKKGRGKSMRKRRRVVEEEDDEDYVEEEEEEVRRKVARPTVRRGSFAKKEDSDFEEEVSREVARPTVRRGSFAKMDDSDYEGEEEEVRRDVARPRVRRCSLAKKENSDFEEEEEEVRREVARPTVRRGSLAKKEDSDFEGEEEEEEVRREVARPTVRRGSLAKKEDSDFEGEEDEEEEEEEVRREVARPTVRRGSLAEKEDSDYEGEEEEEEVEVRRVIARPTVRRGSLAEKEDSDYEGEEEEEEVRRVIARPTVRRGSLAKKEDSDYEGEEEVVRREVARRTVRRGSYAKDEDSDYEGEEEEEDVMEVARSTVRRGSSAKEEDSDYEGEEEEEDVMEVAKPTVRRGSSAKAEDSDYEVEEEEKEVRREVARPTVRRGSFAEEEDSDYKGEEEEEEKNREVARLPQGSFAKEKSGDKSTTKRKRGSGEEEEDEDEDYEGEEEEEEEEDDEEFVVDEDDCLDEEEEPTLTRKKITKPNRRGLHGKGPRGGRRSKKKSASAMEPTRKRGKKKRRLKRKNRVVVDKDDDFVCDDDSDGDFRSRVSVARKRSKPILAHKRSKCRVLSDSDHVSSASSNHEYTISEEEREQMKEAKKLCGSMKVELRSSSSARRTQSAEDLSQFKKPPVRRGKEKVEELKIEVVKQVCGICLSEEDKRRLRGTLDCCSHYFCFTCIMEWSRVESRCPLCKQRFKTISKPARIAAGVDLREVAIQVPERDQVYQPSEEELRSYLDPYENVMCSECQQGGDDGLMLLCDLCDSSAHTYCVGLGHEVPEGNWYCEGCRPVAMVSSSPRPQDSLSEQRTANNLYNRPSPLVNIGESVDTTLTPSPSPRTPFSPGFGGLASPRLPFTDIPAASPMLGTGAPTLSGRRRIHRHIQSLFYGNNRMNLMAMRGDGILTPNLTNDILTSQIAQHREATTQQPRMQENGISSSTFEESSRSVPLTGIFSPRLVNPRRDVVQGPSTTTTVSAGFNLNLWPEHAGISSISGNDQFSARLNTGFIGSPCIVKEEIDLSLAMDQLQSTVRNHLKTLSRDIDLGNNFNDIASHSTQTILAACGLEHIRSEVHTVPQPSVCPHVERLNSGQISLLKGCCSSCFDSFVKDVVKRIMDTSLPQWLSLGL